MKTASPTVFSNKPHRILNTTKKIKKYWKNLNGTSRQLSTQKYPALPKTESKLLLLTMLGPLLTGLVLKASKPKEPMIPSKPAITDSWQKTADSTKNLK